MSTAAQIAGQQNQHDERNRDIQPVALPEEPDHRKRHAGDGRSDQQEHPKLDDSAPVQRRRIGNYSADRAQVTWFASEDAVMRSSDAVTQVDDSSARHHGTREKHASSKHVPEQGVELVVRPCAALGNHVTVFA